MPSFAFISLGLALHPRPLQSTSCRKDTGDRLPFCLMYYAEFKFAECWNERLFKWRYSPRRFSSRSAIALHHESLPCLFKRSSTQNIYSVQHRKCQKDGSSRPRASSSSWPAYTGHLQTNTRAISRREGKGRIPTFSFYSPRTYSKPWTSYQIHEVNILLNFTS